MADMTDEEYDVLDKVTASYILTQAEATNQTPAQVIGKLVHKEIAAGI